MLYLLIASVAISAILFIGYIVAINRISKMIIIFNLYEKEVNKLVKGINSSYKQAELLGSVKERFKQFQELTGDQQSLLGQVDRPSAGAAHSKYKNSIIGELKFLEEKKKEILKSVLDDGFDVEITMLDMKGAKSKMKISEFLNEQSISSENTESNNPQEAGKILRLVKQPLRLVKEEKSDDTNGTIIH